MIEEPPPATPKLRLVGMVWGAVGIIALVVGLLAKLTAVAIFGALALVAGVLVYSAQAYREASAARTRRRMAGGPVSPMAAPAPVPDVGPGSVPSGLQGRPGYRRRPWLRNEPSETLEDPVGTGGEDSGKDSGEHGGEKSVEERGEGSTEDPAGDGLSDLETGEEDAHSETISEQDDGYGNTADGDEVERGS